MHLLSDIDQDCIALATQGKCEFYDCFFERYHCHDFLLADAKTICMKLEDRLDRLTEPVSCVIYHAFHKISAKFPHLEPMRSLWILDGVF
jgi:hypothetical protein